MTFLAQFFSLEAAMLAANIRENERSIALQEIRIFHSFYS